MKNIETHIDYTCNIDQTQSYVSCMHTLYLCFDCCCRDRERERDYSEVKALGGR